jgi:HEAT repeat protein
MAVLLVLSLLQDLAEAKKALQAAVQSVDEAAARSALDSLGAAQSPEAIDAILASLGAAKRSELSRDSERRTLSTQLNEVERKWEQANKTNAEARAEYDKDKRNKKALDTANESAKVSRECSDKAKTLREQIAGVEARARAASAIRLMLVETLGGFSGESAVQHLLGLLKTSKDSGVRAGLCSAFERIKNEAAVESLAAAARDKEPVVRVAALDALAAQGKKTPEVVAAIREAAGETEYWQVCFAALQAAKALKATEAVDAIIAAMAKTEGRLRYDILETLTALTGEDKGISPEAWKSWHEARGGEPATARPDPAPGVGKEAGHTTFFGIPVKSTRVVFVLDRSGSMAEPAGWVPEEATGAPKLPPELQKPAGTRKIDVARWQLKKVLAQMPNGAEFDIVFYHGTFEVYKPQMIRLSDATRKEAYKYIDSLEPFGQTNVFDSVERAMQFALGPDGRITKLGADTIYLLSDGLPNRGKFTNPNDILAQIARQNDALKMTINTIWVGTLPQGSDEKAVAAAKSGETFMDRLAKENGGRFVNGR